MAELHMLVWLGLFGLVASFHAIILGYSRQMFAQAREGFLPAFLARLHPRFATPHWAILSGGAIGIAAILSDRLLAFRGQSLTATLVTLSVLGALTMYIVSVASLFKLRASEPMMERPDLAPGYPRVPGFALLGAVVALGLMVYFNALVACIYTGLLVVFYSVFRSGTEPGGQRQQTPDQLIR